jgi:hypothetical protein
MSIQPDSFGEPLGDGEKAIFDGIVRHEETGFSPDGRAILWSDEAHKQQYKSWRPIQAPPPEVTFWDKVAKLAAEETKELISLQIGRILSREEIARLLHDDPLGDD